jgi:hypothetical protein
VSGALDLLREQPRLLHPAFDISQGIMTVGFRVETSTVQGEIKSTPIMVLAQPDGSVRVLQELGEVDALVRYRRPQGALTLVNEQWPPTDLAAFARKPESLAGGELYARLSTRLRRHVDLDHDGKCTIVVCWAIVTYLYPMFSSVPFLHLLGPKGTGKSQVLDVLQQISRSGYKARVTAPVLGDLIAARRITPLIDQADNLTSEHIDLLADSYRVGGRRAIVDKEHRGEPLEFETFGPKAFAGTRPLDPDMLDRAILIVTSPAARRVEAVLPSDATWAELRASVYRWALQNAHRIPALAPFVDPAWPGLAEYEGRQRELWLPIECVMEALGVPEEERTAAREYYRRSQSSTRAELGDDKRHLLHVLCDVVGDCEEVQVTSADLLSRLASAVSIQSNGAWTPQKLGVDLKALAVLRAQPKRIERNTERVYLIDGRAVRSACQRFQVTD